MAESQSLKSCFVEAESKRKALEARGDTTGNDFQVELDKTIRKYDECLKIADQVSLFSPNESLEDVSSVDLQYYSHYPAPRSPALIETRYFLIHYHTAELVLRVINGERRAILRQSRRAFEQYLKLVDSYDILTREETKDYERYTDSPDTFSTVASPDAAARRQQKIDRYRQEKALKSKLEQLQKDPKMLPNDESLLRTLNLTHISHCTHQTFKCLESIALELQVLAMAPPSNSGDYGPRVVDERVDANKTSDGYSERLDGSLSSLLQNTRGGPILSSSGRPLKPFTLLDSRQRLQQGVFRPDHSLPTMTIDEYLEEERKRGGIIDGGGPQSQVKPEVNEDDLVRADEETMKARRWDDYKDENPRGSGNTMNMG